MTSEYCERSINYTVIIDTMNNFSNNLHDVDQTIVIKTIIGETTITVPGLIPKQLYMVQVSALVSSCESLSAEKNFTKSGDLTKYTINR